MNGNLLTVKGKQEIKITNGATPDETKVFLNGQEVQGMVTALRVDLSNDGLPTVRMVLVPGALEIILRDCTLVLDEPVEG